MNVLKYSIFVHFIYCGFVRSNGKTKIPMFLKLKGSYMSIEKHWNFRFARLFIFCWNIENVDDMCEIMRHQLIIILLHIVSIGWKIRLTLVFWTHELFNIPPANYAFLQSLFKNRKFCKFVTMFVFFHRCKFWRKIRSNLRSRILWNFPFEGKSCSCTEFLSKVSHVERCNSFVTISAERSARTRGLRNQYHGYDPGQLTLALAQFAS